MSSSLDPDQVLRMRNVLSNFRPRLDTLPKLFVTWLINSVWIQISLYKRFSTSTLRFVSIVHLVLWLIEIFGAISAGLK